VVSTHRRAPKGTTRRVRIVKAEAAEERSGSSGRTISSDRGRIAVDVAAKSQPCPAGPGLKSASEPLADPFVRASRESVVSAIGARSNPYHFPDVASVTVRPRLAAQAHGALPGRH